MKIFSKSNKERLVLRIRVFLSILMALVSFNGLSLSAFAAGGLTNAKVTLSDPRPDATADSVTYTVTWKAATTATIRCIVYNFYTTANGTTAPTGFSSTNATKGTFTNLIAANWTIANTSNQVKLTYLTGESVAANTQVTTPLLTITNPTNTAGETNYLQMTTYTDTACTTPSGGNDTATVAFATKPAVLVTATIDPTLTFTVGGVASSTTYKGTLQTSDRCGTPTATAITFGTSSLRLAADANYDCAQSLTTSTNAQTGYQVTVQGKQASGDFMKMNGAATNTVTNWTGTNTTPTATATSGSSEQFAYTTNDGTLSGTGNRFTATDNLFAGLTTTADEVAYAAGPVSSDAVNVGYRLRFAGSTEAGTYQGTLVYTCTPTF